MDKKPSREDFSLFTLELANLVRSGLPLSKGLRHISKEVRSPVFRSQIGAIEKSLEQGKSLSEALAAFPGSFSAEYVTLVKAGEEGGNLAEVLHHLTHYAQYQARIKAKIKTGLAYPLSILVFASLIFLFILGYIVPFYTHLYAGIGTSIPALTRFIFRVSSLFRNHTIETFLALGIGGILLYYLLNFIFRGIWDRIKLKLPIVGALFRWKVLVHYCEVVGYLLKQKIPVVEALRLAAKTSDNSYASTEFNRMAFEVEQGNNLSDEMEIGRFFPPALVWMVSVAEQQERVDEVLQEASSLYMDHLENWSERVAILIEPVLIFLVGGMIGMIVVALYFPLFKLGDIL